MVWMALVAPLVALTDVGDNRIRSLLLRLHGRRKCVFRLDRNRVALSLDIPSDCIPLHLLPLCGPHGCGVRRPLSIPERTRVPMPGSDPGLHRTTDRGGTGRRAGTGAVRTPTLARRWRSGFARQPAGR